MGQLGGDRRDPVTHYNDALKPMWGKPESIHWTSDRFAMQGWLLYPAHYDPGKKYPLIVSVHGGPSSAVSPAGRTWATTPLPSPPWITSC